MPGTLFERTKFPNGVGSLDGILIRVTSGSVVAEPERENRVAPQRVPHELAMTLWTEIVASMMTRLAIIFRHCFIGDPFQHLMQLRQMIDIVCQIIDRFVRCCLDVDLNDIPSLFGDIDLALATIAGVMDHQESPKVSSPHGGLSTLLWESKNQQSSPWDTFMVVALMWRSQDK